MCLGPGSGPGPGPKVCGWGGVFNLRGAAWGGVALPGPVWRECSPLVPCVPTYAVLLASYAESMVGVYNITSSSLQFIGVWIYRFHIGELFFSVFSFCCYQEKVVLGLLPRPPHRKANIDKKKIGHACNQDCKKFCILMFQM